MNSQVVELHRLEARGGTDFKFYLRDTNPDAPPTSFIFTGFALAELNHDDIAKAIVGASFSTPIRVGGIPARGKPERFASSHS